LLNVKEQIVAHKTAAAVIVAVFLLSVAAIIFTLKQPDNTTSGQNSSTASSRLSVAVNEIHQTQGKSNSSSSAASAQAILLSSDDQDQLPYSPKTSSPADGFARPASSASDKDKQQTANSVKKIEAPASVTITVGESQSINVRLQPEDTIDKAVGWSSDNPGIASVDKTGMVTANRVGTCRITVCSERYNQTRAVIVITVESE
jgi:uncharacterized protein YjdB